MRRHCGKKGYFLISIVLGIFILAPIVQVAAQDAKTVESDLQTEPLIAENVDSHIVGMSDVQIRQAYAKKLKQEARVQSVSAQVLKSTRQMNEVSTKFYGLHRVR